MQLVKLSNTYGSVFMVKMQKAFAFCHISPYYLSLKNSVSAFCTRGLVTIITTICICDFPAEPPNIPHTGDIINQTILIGFSTELECKATGSPLPGNMARISDTPSNTWHTILTMTVFLILMSYIRCSYHLVQRWPTTDKCSGADHTEAWTAAGDRTGSVIWCWRIQMRSREHCWRRRDVPPSSGVRWVTIFPVFGLIVSEFRWTEPCNVSCFLLCCGSSSSHRQPRWHSDSFGERTCQTGVWGHGGSFTEPHVAERRQPRGQCLARPAGCHRSSFHTDASWDVGDLAL